jgi:hypothetical protein
MWQSSNVKQEQYQNFIHAEIKGRLNSGNACYHAIQNLLFSHLLFKNIKIKIYKTNFTHCFVWERNLVSHVKVKTQIEGV